MVFFDSSTVPDVDFDALPQGQYHLLVQKAEIKPTKNGNGRLVAVEFVVCQGQYQGRKVFDRFNIENLSEDAQRIGRAQFKKFLAACGMPPVLQTEDDVYRLADKAVLAELVVEKSTYNGENQNRVKKYMSRLQPMAGQPSFAPGPTANQPSTQPPPPRRGGIDNVPF